MSMLISLIENPERNPPSTILEINLLKASITKTKSNGDKPSPCCKPRELLKKLVGVPFTNIEKQMIENNA